MTTYEEIREYMEQEDIQFVRLIFTDAAGREKCVTIMPEELERAFREGISFDGSAVDGFDRGPRSDLFLRPDPATLSPVPWHPLRGRMVRFYCDICDSAGRSVAADTRSLLRRAIRSAEEKGISCRFGTEFEFYIFKTDAEGNRTSIPFDNAGYMDIDPGDRCESLRRDICFTLMEMGIQPESAHHEEGPGQNEIDFRPADPLTAADNAVTFQSVVRTIAIRNGLYASFYPKPLPQMSGNGLHLNMSIRSRDGEDHLLSFMAGILEHIEEITIFLNPTDESYRRLGKFKAPSYISWAPENRSQLIRLPAGGGERRRIELRSPDSGMNPYLGFALLICAGLDGVERGLRPMEPVQENLYAADPALLQTLRRLPATRAEALERARESAWLRTVLPEELLPR